MEKKTELAREIAESTESFSLAIPPPENPTTKIEKSEYIGFINHEIVSSEFKCNIMDLLRTLHDLGETHLNKNDLYRHRDRLQESYKENIDKVREEVEESTEDTIERLDHAKAEHEQVKEAVDTKVELVKRGLEDIDPDELTDDQRVMYDRVHELYTSILNVLDEYYQQIDVMAEYNWLFHVQKQRVTKSVEIETSLGMNLKDTESGIRTLRKLLADVKTLQQEVGNLPNMQRGEIPAGGNTYVNIDNRKVELNEQRQDNIQTYIDQFEQDTKQITGDTE